jgi:hypothetical protein
VKGRWLAQGEPRWEDRDPWLKTAPTALVALEWVSILIDHARPAGHAPAVCFLAGSATVFEDVQDATDAAIELREAGAPVLTALLCDFADQHWHLTDEA